MSTGQYDDELFDDGDIFSDDDEYDENESDQASPAKRVAPPDADAHLLSYCYKCGVPWNPEGIICAACGGADEARGSARPLVASTHDIETFGGPWHLVPWPKTGSVAMYGGPGSGKSSLAALIRPSTWITKEQEPKPVGDMFRRLIPGFMPQIFAVESAVDVARYLSLMDEGPVVVDSLSAFSLKEAMEIANMLTLWARGRIFGRTKADRALGILQVNSQGQTHGYMGIPHIFDCVVNLQPDPWGVRGFGVEKSRWSPQCKLYWRFDEKGQIALPDFDAAYSVEGTPGNYWLHPFPLQGAKWTGLCRQLAEDDALEPRTASAAIIAPYMPNGFVEPTDRAERRHFALSNGLRWVSPADAPTSDREDQ